MQRAQGLVGLGLGARVVEGDLGALAREGQTDGAAEPSGSAGDERDLAVEEAPGQPTTGSDLVQGFLPQGAIGVSGPLAVPRWNMLKPHAGITRPSICG